MGGKIRACEFLSKGAGSLWRGGGHNLGQSHQCLKYIWSVPATVTIRNNTIQIEMKVWQLIFLSNLWKDMITEYYKLFGNHVLADSKIISIEKVNNVLPVSLTNLKYSQPVARKPSTPSDGNKRFLTGTHYFTNRHPPHILYKTRSNS